MSNNELKEYQVGTTAMPLADMSKINQGTVAIESSRAMVEAQGKCRIICNDGYDDVLTPTLYFEVDRQNPRVEVTVEVVEDE